MAITLKKQLAFDIGGIVTATIQSAQIEKSKKRATVETEFQKAIANGMSYNAQLQFRQKQLADEQASSIVDETIVSDLTKSISDTKKLIRFDNYKTKTLNAYAEYNGGKINELKLLDILKNQLVGVNDSELRLSILQDISTGEELVKKYNDSIITNQVNRAQKDGTVSVLNDAISRVSNARLNASISDKQDEVTAYDATLTALNSQLNGAKISDSIFNFQSTSASKGSSAIEKYNFITNELANADATIPIKIGDKTYTSVKEYWFNQQTKYFDGSNTIFGNFFEDLGNQIKDKINVTASIHGGYPTQAVLDESSNIFNSLKAKPELTPFLDKIEITRNAALESSVKTMAKNIVDIGTQNLDFISANAQLDAIASKYNINLDANKIDLRNNNISSFPALITKFGEQGANQRNIEGVLPIPQLGGGNKTEAAATIVSPPTFPITPSTPPTTPATPTPPTPKPTIAPPTPTATPTPTPTGGEHIVQSGDTLSGIASKAGMTLNQILELNPQFKANPNLINPGQTIKLAATVTPATPPVIPSTTPPTATIPPATSTPTPTTTPTPTPIPPTTPPVDKKAELTKLIEAGQGRLAALQKEMSVKPTISSLADIGKTLTMQNIPQDKIDEYKTTQTLVQGLQKELNKQITQETPSTIGTYIQKIGGWLEASKLRTEEAQKQKNAALAQQEQARQQDLQKAKTQFENFINKPLF